MYVCPKRIHFFSLQQKPKNKNKNPYPLIQWWQHKLVVEFIYLFISFFLSWVAFASKINSSCFVFCCNNTEFAMNFPTKSDQVVVVVVGYNLIESKTFFGGWHCLRNQKFPSSFLYDFKIIITQTLVTEYFSFVCFCGPHLKICHLKK